jgi:hypothetical protein
MRCISFAALNCVLFPTKAFVIGPHASAARRRLRILPFDRAERDGKNEIGEIFPKRINSARTEKKMIFRRLSRPGRKK